MKGGNTTKVGEIPKIAEKKPMTDTKGRSLLGVLRRIEFYPNSLKFCPDDYADSVFFSRIRKRICH